MTIPLQQIASLVDGNLQGDPELICVGANPPAEVREGEITMLDDVGNVAAVAQSPAVAIVLAQPLPVSHAQIIVADPHAAFAKIVAIFRPPIENEIPVAGIDPTAIIAASAQVHPGATIGAGATVGARTVIMPGAVVMPQCRIGEDCVLHANVTLYQYTQIEARVVIHAGAVLGANGFGYRLEEGKHVPTAQLGYVHVHKDVEIGAGTTIDRGTYGATRIGEGTKIDNQVMIAHNCQIGRHNLLCSQVGIAGSCCTGDYVVLAGQVGLKDHIRLGDNTVVGAQAGVMDDCPGNQIYLGSPTTTQREQMQIMAVERRLPEMRKEVKQLRRELEQLQRQMVQQQSPADLGDSRAA
ncbi:MAG: UDP-3-O-(3-hydroxymyristoyl)glucosamine N-acyltransferase [Pirellulales bacterium]|nr:UDP-3-O-(3-hydroxymyristoyl)glucosamine N-acyltransferase [Pirellulales bacterium]